MASVQGKQPAANRWHPPVLLTAILVAIATCPAAGDQDGKTPQQWLELIGQRKPPAPDAKLADLRRGCTLEVTYRPMFKPKWDAERKECLGRYRAWVEREGNAMIDRWLGGKPLSADERNYLPILKATYMFRAWGNGGPRRTKTPEPPDQYVKQVAQRGETLLRKGFVGTPLTAAEIDELGDYRIYTAMRLCNARLLPFEVGASRGRNAPFRPGEEAPGFTLLTLEAALKRDTYTDELIQDDTAFLKPGRAAKLLEIMSHYGPAEAGKGACVKKPVSIPAGEEGDYVRLSDFRGKTPVVIVLAYPPDVFMKCCLPPLEVLRQACKGHAEILLVNINYHDTYAAGPVYFGPHANPKGARLTHPNCIEQRARLGKHLYMTYPSATIPMVLDDMGQTTRNRYMAQGGDARFLVIDKAGRIAYDGPSSWYAWTKGGYTDTVTWLNGMEIELRKVLANGGLAEAGRKQFRLGRGHVFMHTVRPARRKAFAARQAKPYAYMKPWSKHIWLTGRIKSIDGETFIIAPNLPDKARMKGYNFIRDAGGRAKPDAPAKINLKALEQWLKDAEAGVEYKFTVGDDVELFINGREAEPDQFRAGDFVGVWYDLNLDVRKATVKPIHVRASRLP